jgi:flagellar motor protein MotB
MKNLKSLLVILMLLTAGSVSAQYDQSKINKKAIEAYRKAMEKAQDGKYGEAIESLKEAIQRDAKFIDAYLSIAGLYGQIKDYKNSITYYEKAFPLDTGYTFEYRLPYSINLAGMGRFSEAMKAVDELLARTKINPNARKAAEFRKKTFQFALDYERTKKDSNYVFAPKNLGDAINSKESEYFPSIPIESDELIFTRRLRNFNEDFFGSRKNNGNWEPATPLPGSINTPDNEGAQNISQDAKWLVFTGCNRPDGLGGCDLYISYLGKSGWSDAINLGNRINSESWDSQPSLSPDKRDLYFSSRRTGGYGGSDLYVSHIQSNGKWSDPENLGPEINTPGDESGPFIHADNQTLYFASSYLPGYGADDLFLVRKDSNGKWGKPENLGYPINTIDHEGTIFIAADARTAYYASDRSDSRGGLDIYSFELRKDIRPFTTTWVKGKVTDVKTGMGLPSGVELTDLATGQIISKVQTDETGNYLITLPVGKDYVFNVNRRGYLFYSDNYSLRNKAGDSVYVKNIALQPIEVNAGVVLRNVFFDFNKYDLKPESRVELDKLVQLMSENPGLKIRLEGHTDNVGNAAQNLKLSENRAKAVVDYLISKGIGKERLTSKGFGATQPVAGNDTEEGRAKNRRTGLVVVAR